MSTDSMDRQFTAREQEEPRILIFSQRNLTAIQPFRCAHFEFEDVIAEVDSVDFLAPRFSVSSRRYNLVKKLAYKTPFHLNPGVPQTSIRSGYDLFFAVCGNPTDLLHIRALGDWRSKCRTAICLIDELWITQMERYDPFLRMLEPFDMVVVYYSQSVEPLNRRIGQKCIFMPPGVDALRFCPYPDAADRSIDVYSVGRRSAVTHQSILKMAEGRGAFYLYDSTSADRVLQPIEHRELFANTLKRSRYFIVNPGLIDRPDVRGGQIEIGNRYFEGAAAGSIMVGARPDNGQFEKFFNWPNALVELAYDSPAFGEAISSLEANPCEQEELRRMNVRQSLLRHDWAYRWQAILEAAGVAPLPRMNERREKLAALAEGIAPAHAMQSVRTREAAQLSRR